MDKYFLHPKTNQPENMEQLQYRTWDGARMHYKVFTTQSAWSNERDPMTYWGTTIDGDPVYEGDYLYAKGSKRTYLVITVKMEGHSYFDLSDAFTSEILDMIGYEQPILPDDTLVLVGNKHETVLKKKDIQKLREYKKPIFEAVGLKLSSSLNEQAKQSQRNRFSLSSTSDAELDNALLDDFNIKTVGASSASRLESLGMLNKGICPLCGMTPIGKNPSWAYSWSWNAGPKLFICQECSVIGISAQKKKEGCYIATTAYGSEHHPSVETLRRYRDIVLSKSWLGKQFIETYYRISPGIARQLHGRQILNKLIRTLILNPIVNAIRILYRP